MANRGNGKLRLLYVLDILKSHSDEENPLNSQDIIEKLKKCGITAERKSIYDDISLLEVYGADIIKTKVPKTGWFLGEREFEVPEIHLLSDAVRSAKFISSKKTRELLAKLGSMLSENQKHQRIDGVYFSSQDKCANEAIYYSIDKINRAIKGGFQIELEYFSRYFDENRNISRKLRKMIINPYAMCWQDDHYYLIGNHIRHNDLIHLRLDRICGVEILKTPVRHYSEVSNYKDYFDVADYTNRLFGMYSGDFEDIELCCNKKITEQVLDRFSEEIFIKNVTEDEFSFSVKAAITPGTVTWIMNYGDLIKVIKPQKLCLMIKERAEAIIKNYENFGELYANEEEKTS